MRDGGRSLRARHGLPLRSTRLFGRDSEVAQLLDVVDRARLASLVGAAGCGKTRLVIEVGERSVDRFPGGVWFVDLAPLADGVSVAGLVAVGLGIREAPGRAVEEVVVEELTSVVDPLLVLLDNCEHVIGAVADLVDRLLARCPAVQVLVTSRVALGVAGEQVWNVAPLTVQPAMELFVDRASLVSSRFEVVGPDRATVEGICDRLCGLPLAIELAAASTRLLSVNQIVDRLTRALPLPAGGRRAVSPRHETMIAAIDWSLRLLPAAEQRLFGRLSAFAGSFDLEAAEAVVGIDGQDVLSELTTLVDHSLVVAEVVPRGAMRYRMLEPVRQCAATGLAASGDSVRRRHAEHYLALASGFDPLGLRRKRSTITLQHLEQEEGNLLAALHWARRQPSDLELRLCEALAPYWEFGGRVNDGRTWFEHALAVDTVDQPLRVRALGWAARLAWRQGDYERARLLDEERLDLARQLGDTVGCAAAHCTLGLVAFSRGDADTAVEHCQESISLARQVGAEPVALWALMVLGWARVGMDDLPGGEATLSEALAASRTVGNASVAAQALIGLQTVAFLHGDVAAQRGHLTDALAAMNDGGVIELSDWLGCCSSMALAEGRPRSALRLLGGAETFNRRRGSQYPRWVMEVVTERCERIRGDLGPTLSDRLTAEGATMSWDELVAEALAEPPRVSDHPLTSRELEVAGLVAEGLTNTEVARKLCISRRTVETHVDHIREKLKLRNRQEIVIWVLREGPADNGP